jgi:hypothetical protein
LLQAALPLSMGPTNWCGDVQFFASPLPQRQPHAPQFIGSELRSVSHPSLVTLVQCQKPIVHISTAQMPSWHLAVAFGRLHGLQSPRALHPTFGAFIETHFPPHAFLSAPQALSSKRSVSTVSEHEPRDATPAAARHPMTRARLAHRAQSRNRSIARRFIPAA